MVGDKNLVDSISCCLDFINKNIVMKIVDVKGMIGSDKKN